MATSLHLQDHIISRLNLDALPDAERAELLEKMTEVIEGRVLLRVLQTLNGKEKQAFTEILDTGNDKALKLFLVSHVPNFLEILEEETQALRQGLLEQIGGKK